MKAFYVTTPIYYVNDVPHLGHAYTTVVADTIARFRRLTGRRVYFLTGTDEHGQKIERSAARQGISPQQLADRVVARYHELWGVLDIRNDDFIRTTDARHRKGVEAIFERIRDKGDIYLDSYEGLYCTGCEAYYAENVVVDGKCPDLGHPVETLREASYFFRLSRYQEPLLKLYEEHPEFVRPAFRLNEVKRFVEMGLKDLSISRTSFSWGIPFPGNPEHIFYVWFDALCNYVTALGYADGADLYGDCWPADLHLVGKDILRFHAVYWPAFLMSAGLPLPRTVFAHGWWLRSAAKMSKSTGNLVDPRDLIADFGSDALRYFLLREMAFGQDAQYSEEALLDRVNNDLANDLGNLVSRTLKMLEDFCGGSIPGRIPGGEADDLSETAGRAIDEYRAAFEEYRFHEGLASLWSLVGEINRYIVRWEPWSLAKDPGRKPTLDTVLYSAAEALRIIAIAISPVMPTASARILRQLGTPEASGGWTLEDCAWGGLEPGRTVKRGEGLFPRIDKVKYFSTAKETAMDTPDRTPDTITIDDFMKVKLRAGKILEAGKVEGADKLLKLLVDIGEEKRTVLAGIARQYDPASLVGKTIILVANLAPRTMRGVESQGMILAADVDGAPIIAEFESDVRPGAVVR